MTTTTSSPESRCTCPTGDGSLRWPCPQHLPRAVERAAADLAAAEVAHAAALALADAVVLDAATRLELGLGPLPTIRTYRPDPQEDDR